MTTCNQLDLETLGSRPILVKNQGVVTPSRLTEVRDVDMASFTVSMQRE
jgi:hypothetical protein